MAADRGPRVPKIVDDPADSVGILVAECRHGSHDSRFKRLAIQAVGEAVENDADQPFRGGQDARRVAEGGERRLLGTGDGLPPIGWSMELTRFRGLRVR